MGKTLTIWIPAFLCILLLCGFSFQCFAELLDGPVGYFTNRTGTNAASGGLEIILPPGTPQKKVNFSAKSVALHNLSKPAVAVDTVVDARINRTASLQKPPAPNGVQSISTYESRIGETGLLLEDSNLQMWVPQSYQEHSQVIYEYLQDGYDVLCELFGGHDMPVKFSVEHYPEGSPYFWGGTDGQGTIRYSYVNLEDDYPEWNLHEVSHVIGYYEEMAHCFARDLGLRGEHSVGYYETLGLMIGSETTLRAAWNPYIQQWVENNYQKFAATTQYYLEHNTGESGVPENIYLTRILAHIFKTEVVDAYGWSALSDAFEAIQEGYPLRYYARDHRWGGFLQYLCDVTGADFHTIFRNYGLPFMQWTGETGYESDGVEQTGGDHQYSFRIKLFDREGSQPTNVKLHLYESATADGNSFTMSFVQGNAESGWIYQKNVEIHAPEQYKYAFSADDSVHNIFQAVGQPTVKKFLIERAGAEWTWLLLY